MYEKGKDVLSIAAMLSLMPLIVTTARYFLETVFPADLLVGSIALIASMVWFVRRAEKKGSPTLALLALVVMFLAWTQIGTEESMLYSSRSWLISVSVWLMLSIWISVGTLLGKAYPEPGRPAHW